MGSFPEYDEIPTRNDIRKWVHQTWIGVHGIQVFDMSGIQFLFEFQNEKDAEYISRGEWQKGEDSISRGGHCWQGRTHLIPDFTGS